MTQIVVSVLIEDACRDHFAEVVESCRSAGMVIQREMAQLGVISGSIDSSDIDILSQLQGVARIEKTRDVKCLDEQSSPLRRFI
jgi:hypothetical protein